MVFLLPYPQQICDRAAPRESCSLLAVPELALLQSPCPCLGLTWSPQICQIFPETHLETCFVLSILVAPTYLRPHCRVNSTDLNSTTESHCSKLPTVLSYKFTWFIYFRFFFFFFTTALNFICRIFCKCLLPVGGLLLLAAGQTAVILLVSKAAENAYCFLNVPLPGQCTHCSRESKRAPALQN